MLSSEDMLVWNELKKTVFRGDFGIRKEDLPPRLKVRCSEEKMLPFCLDLHRMTLEEAYQQTLIFLRKHYQLRTKKVEVITGKGRDGRGLIRTEFMGWLDTNAFKKYVREAQWTNDEGAINLWLKKSK